MTVSILPRLDIFFECCWLILPIKLFICWILNGPGMQHTLYMLADLILKICCDLRINWCCSIHYCYYWVICKYYYLTKSCNYISFPTHILFSFCIMQGHFYKAAKSQIFLQGFNFVTKIKIILMFLNVFFIYVEGITVIKYITVLKNHKVVIWSFYKISLTLIVSV